MAETLESRINLLLNSGGVLRYHCHRPGLIGVQTVGEHTYRAMVLMTCLWPEYTKNALTALLEHDGAESLVGDVPNPVKTENPDLGRELSEAEHRVLSQYGLGLALYQEEHRWVKICDWIEGLTFALDQMRLGNRGMAQVFNVYLDCLNTLEQVPASAVQYMYHLRNLAKDLFPGDIA